MRRFAAGVVVGMVLSGGLAAQGNFYSAQELLKTESLFQLGYLAGAYDTLKFVNYVLTNSKDSYETDHKRLAGWIDCLQFRSRRLGALQQFALSIWEEAPKNQQELTASGVLIAKACEK